MLEQIKQRIEDLTPTHGDLIAASEYVKACRYLIGEVERLKGIEEHAIKRIKAETQENSRWIAFVEHLQNISLCNMTKNEIRQALNTFAREGVNPNE